MADPALHTFCATPVYDAPPDGAQPAPCPYCSRAITAGDVRLHSLFQAGACHWFQTHRSCDDMAPVARDLDDFIASLIRKTEGVTTHA